MEDVKCIKGESSVVTCPHGVSENERNLFRTELQPIFSCDNLAVSPAVTGAYIPFSHPYFEWTLE